MDVLLRLEVYQGLLIVILPVVLAGLLVVLLVKKLIKAKITKQHEKIGRLLFRVTAGLIALLVSLSYANERMQQYKIIDSLELEASMIVNVVAKLKIFDSEEAHEIRAYLFNYVDSTIEQDWKYIRDNPYFSETSQFIIDAHKMAYSLPYNNEEEKKIKNDLIHEINQILTLMQVRMYSHHILTPNLIYILSVGLLFMWIFFTVYKLDFIALSFLSLYNIFIAILIYFIFILGNPMNGPLKIDAHAFKILKTKGIELSIK